MFGEQALWHLVPFIIDGQGQGACQSLSTQPECDKATPSDRATCRFLTPFTFDGNFTDPHTFGTNESHQEMEVKLK